MDEKIVPYWLVAEAVGRALDEDVQGIEPRANDSYAVLVERGDGDGQE